MTLYELLLFVHVTAIVAWIGGAAMHLALVTLARRMNDRATQLTLLRYDDMLAARLYLPAAAVTLAAGIGLVLEGNWAWDQAWIVLGLVLFGAALVFGVLFFLPQGKRLHEAIEAHGADSSAVGTVIDRIYVGAWADLAILVAAVFVMTTKPGL